MVWMGIFIDHFERGPQPGIPSPGLNSLSNEIISNLCKPYVDWISINDTLENNIKITFENYQKLLKITLKITENLLRITEANLNSKIPIFPFCAL